MTNDYTYQEKITECPLEQYEWERIWFEDVYDTEAKRVLYIGDSISNATFPYATSEAGRNLIFNNFASSKGLDNPYYYPMIKMFIEQNERKDAIIINNGLHGWHLDDDKYEELYLKLVENIKKCSPDTPIFIVLTTAVDDAREFSQRVPKRNERAIAVAKKADAGILDLYSVSKANKALLCDDGVHFIPEGYEVLGKEIIRALGENQIIG